MASNDNENLYAVLGLKKECTATELRTAYKKLALVSFFFFIEIQNSDWILMPGFGVLHVISI